MALGGSPASISTHRDKLAVNDRKYFLCRKLAFSYLGYYLFLIKSRYTLMTTTMSREKKYVLIA